MEYANRLAVEPSSHASPSLAPVLVAGSSAAARSRGIAQVEGAGLRLAGAVEVGAAMDRLDQQALASAVWLELDSDGGEPLDRLLDRVDRDAAAGRYAAIVAARGDLIDPVAARLSSGKVEVLIDGDEGERAAALALAIFRPLQGAQVSDVATDTSAARLRQLSDEVGRIAATLSRLSGGPVAGSAQLPRTPPPLVDAPAPEISPDLVRSVIRARWVPRASSPRICSPTRRGTCCST